MTRNVERLTGLIRRDGLLGAFRRVFTRVFGGVLTLLSYLVRSYLLDKRGVLVKGFKLRFAKPISPRFKMFGNYFLDPAGLNSNSVVYSFGIGRNIKFDTAVVQEVGCRVYAYDPTPFSVAYMATHKYDPRIVFAPIGVWTEDGKVSFRVIEDDSGTPLSGSITNIHNLQSNAHAWDVRTLATLMRDNQHDHVDVLKMDIEGAAVPVLAQIIAGKNFPKQIVAELEFPKIVSWQFLKELYGVLRGLEAAGYELFCQRPRLVNLNFSIELVAVARHQ